ncbi:hypothetical protein FRB96_000202 [Tulasnella sp. 330]|nr:hypothetical protein FRB96_000202 [Tulasnella sp. 330]
MLTTPLQFQNPVQLNFSIHRLKTAFAYGRRMICGEHVLRANCTLHSTQLPFPREAGFASWSQNCNASDGTLDPDTAAILPKWVTVVGGNAKNSIVPNFNLTMALDTAALDPASNSPTANASPAGTLIGPTQSVPTVNTGSSLSGSGKSSNVGPIVGGVLGGVLLIALSTLLTLFYRRRERQKRVAPSSEFTKYLQQPTLRRPPSQQEYKDVPEVAAVAPHIEEAPEYQRPADPDVEELPGFTPGHYAGPIFEKGGYVADPNSPVHSSPTTHGSSSHPQN